MPQVAAAIAFVAEAAATAVFNAAPAAIAAQAATFTFAAVEVGTYAGIGLGLNALFGPKPPPMAAVQNPLKQGVASRRSGFGRTRLSGIYALYEADAGVSFDVLALHDGEIEGFVTFYLNDDEVEVDPSTGGVWCPSDTKKYAYGGPPGDRVFIETKRGTDIDTVFGRAHAGLPAIWTTAHRGVGVAAMALTCKQSKPKFQMEDFPNGLPVPSAVADLQKVFDPRTVDPVNWSLAAFRPFWTWSQNPVICLLQYLTQSPATPGLDYVTRFLPRITDWIAAADVCDELVDKADGTTEPRYALGGGVYNHDGDPAEVIETLIASFDGWLAPRGDGTYTVLAGKYQAPTVTLTDDHVIGYSIQHYQLDEQAVNVANPTFTDPSAKYQQADAGDVRNEADIAARGVERPKALDYGWLHSPTTARRLAKRVLNRAGQELQGQLVTNFAGFIAMGERYLHLAITENAALTDIIVEVSRVEIDVANLSLTISWVQADPNIDDWDPDAEEIAMPDPGDRPAPRALDAPTITSVTPVYDLAASSDQGARLQIHVDAPISDDVQWLARWRVQGASDWHEATYSDIDDGAAVVLMTGFVTANATLEVQAAYQTAGGISDWSATFEVVVAAPRDAFVDGLVDVLQPGDGTEIINNGDGTITIGATPQSDGETSHPYGFSFQKSVAGITTGDAFAFFDTPVAWDMPASLTDSQGTIGGSGAAAPSAQTDFDIQVGGVSVGTMRFAASSMTATFIKASATHVALGAVTTIVAPADLHGMVGVLFGSIVGTR